MVTAKAKEVEVSKTATEKLVKSDRFFTFPKTTRGKRFFIFCDYGDFIKGKLLSRGSNAHINRTCSYRIAVSEIRQGGEDKPIEDGRLEEFFANRQLQRIIELNELVGSIVRIVYIGRLKSNFGGHSAKVYQVFKVKGFLTESEEEQNGKDSARAGRKTKSRKG